ncbi:hypothetical protein ACOKR6_17110 [Vibrio cholerae]
MSENDHSHDLEQQLESKRRERLTLEQRIKRAEQQLQKLKTQDRRTRNQRLILIGLAAESAAEKNANFRDVLAQHARSVLKPADFKKCEFKNRYGELIE